MADDPPPAGVPEWIVTYGDMMSLLLTFFIMLVSLSEIKGDSKFRAVVESIMRQLGYNAGPPAPTGDSFPLNGMIEKLRTLGSHTNTSRGTGGIKTPGPEGKDLRVFRGRDGTSINVGGPLVFAPGSSEVSDEMRKVLKAIALKLAGKPNKIDVRGHTGPDAAVDVEGEPDQFVLSYDRARHVADVLAKAGIERERMRLSAAADNEPLPQSADKKSVQQDRVEIFVLDTYVKDFIGPRDGFE